MWFDFMIYRYNSHMKAYDMCTDTILIQYHSMVLYRRDVV